MIIKKFQAGTETEAIMLAKNELGKDAIVMNIKTVSPKGIYKFFRKPTVEITAALDENGTFGGQKKEEEKKETNITKRQSYKFNPNIIYEKENAGNSTPEDEMNETSEGDTFAIEKKLNNLQALLEKTVDREKE